MSVAEYCKEKRSEKAAKTVWDEWLGEKSIDAVQADEIVYFLRATESDDSSVDALTWWRRIENKFSHVANVAKDVLAISKHFCFKQKQAVVGIQYDFRSSTFALERCDFGLLMYSLSVWEYRRNIIFSLSVSNRRNKHAKRTSTVRTTNRLYDIRGVGAHFA